MYYNIVKLKININNNNHCWAKSTVPVNFTNININLKALKEPIQFPSNKEIEFWQKLKGV
jgi:hypothetical protein